MGFGKLFEIWEIYDYYPYNYSARGMTDFLQIGIHPGITLRVTKRIALESRFGFFGYHFMGNRYTVFRTDLYVKEQDIIWTLPKGAYVWESLYF